MIGIGMLEIGLLLCGLLVLSTIGIGTVVLLLKLGVIVKKAAEPTQFEQGGDYTLGQGREVGREHEQR